jgi:hypothetical protein
MTVQRTLPTWAKRLVELRCSRGWVVADTARELKQRRGSLPSIQNLTHMIRSDWESGKHRPGPQYRALLCAVYGVHESEVFDGDTSPPQSPSGDEDEMERRKLLQALAALGVSASPITDPLQSIQDSVNRSLGRDETSHLEEWEEALTEYGYTYLVLPPRRLFADLAADLVAVRSITSRSRHRGGLYPDWCRVTGGLAALMAKTLCNLGQPREARTWWVTAQHAADTSHDTDLSLWVSGERMIHGLYERRPTAILLRQANAAAERAPASPCRGLAHIRTVRAQLLALAGQLDEAVQEIHRSHEVFEQLPGAVTDEAGSIAHWGEDRLRYTEAWVYAHLGERGQLDQAVARAHEVLPPAEHRSRTQINLLQAFGHVRAGDVAEGIRHAQATYADYPVEQRTVMVTCLADQVWEVVPSQRRDDPGVTAYRELLTAAPHRKAIT